MLLLVGVALAIGGFFAAEQWKLPLGIATSGVPVTGLLISVAAVLLIGAGAVLRRRLRPS
jgi:uncharacterized integral membrane protein